MTPAICSDGVTVPSRATMVVTGGGGVAEERGAAAEARDAHPEQRTAAATRPRVRSEAGCSTALLASAPPDPTKNRTLSQKQSSPPGGSGSGAVRLACLHERGERLVVRGRDRGPPPHQDDRAVDEVDLGLRAGAQIVEH